MSLVAKLGAINKPKVENLSNGYAKNIKTLWSEFIEPKLPDKSVMLNWHRVLMEFVESTNATYAIRFYNTASSKEKYDDLRRGFLSKTDKGFSFFYTDNFHAAYYLKMVMDGYVPSVEELLDAYNRRLFPARFGKDTSNERALMAMPKGRDPGIGKAGYKIAHIINVGKDYIVNGNNTNLSTIVNEYFDGGTRDDWKLYGGDADKYYLRNCNVAPEAKKYIIAEFLRFVHPFNYFLIPKHGCCASDICNDISEYKPLLSYVMKKYSKLYGSAYEDYLEKILFDENTVDAAVDDDVIDLSYGMVNKKAVNKSKKEEVRCNNGLQKIGQLIQQKVIPILTKLTDGSDIAHLQNLAYCKQIFGLSFPLLVRTDAVFESSRYYKNEITIDGCVYRVCSQWYERQREQIVKWIKDTCVNGEK